jgi:hypothetical protein
VYVYFDESGDYAFRENGFDWYVQAALICPDSVLPSIDTFVEERKAAWGLGEIHASELDLDQLVEVARFIGQSDCQLLTHVTDTVLVTQRGIAQFRLDQAAALKRNLDWYRRESTKAIGAPVSEIEDWYLRYVVSCVDLDSTSVRNTYASWFSKASTSASRYLTCSTPLKNLLWAEVLDITLRLTLTPGADGVAWHRTAPRLPLRSVARAVAKKTAKTGLRCAHANRTPARPSRPR